MHGNLIWRRYERRARPRQASSRRGAQHEAYPVNGSLTLAQIAAACSTGGADLPLPAADAGRGAFAEPWQAHAFALTVLLQERGLFTWGQWASALATEIRRAQAAGDKDDGSSYYQHWLIALEQMLIDRQLGSSEQIHAMEHAWEAAAARTPHGQPIELLATDFEAPKPADTPASP